MVNINDKRTYDELLLSFFFFKQKTAYELRISDWSSDVCSSDLEFRSITAPAVVVDAPQLLNRLHAAGALPRDFVAVVRYQGPRANGMPELHSLAPLLGMLQNQGRRVALVTEDRKSTRLNSSH